MQGLEFLDKMDTLEEGENSGNGLQSGEL